MKYLILLATLFVGSAQAATLKLDWVFDASATATCSDGSPAATNCPPTGFEIQEQINDGTWAVKEGVAATLRTRSYTVQAGRKYCYRLRTNSNGTFSAESPTACVTVPFVPPKAPANVTVTVTVTVE